MLFKPGPTIRKGHVMAHPHTTERTSRTPFRRLRKPTRRQALAAIGIIAIILLALTPLDPEDRGTYVPYSTFMDRVAEGAVEQAVISTDGVAFSLTGDEGLYRTDNPGSPDFRERLLIAGVAVETDAGAMAAFDALVDIVFYAMFLGALGFLAYKLASYSRNTFKVVRHTKTGFDDIAGMEQPKRELMRVVAALKDPKGFQAKGVRPIKGIVLEGPPGNGKTLFARALASEAKVDFIATKGADFQSAFMSLGSRKIRTLFRKARKHRPCIVFIDEFDSIGERRNYTGTGIDKENNRIITAMLNEMDGFSTSDGVLVVAATNSYRSLDPALVRPGRFDLKFTIGNPDAQTRAELVRLYTERAGRALSPGLTRERLAEAFEGLSCAEVEAVLNTAASDALATRNEALITAEDLRDAALRTGVRLKAGVL